ncbi:superoxide dismutase, Fe-Mn family [Nematocida displodere]|uniref:Superoxide dismutase n=1 Tax=Nematocida displodere TaxID=1805483 RepID=A0A177ECR5_9MICR|nr:superoxide dismutase, Fe-Mn family [Nematocida displodere]
MVLEFKTYLEELPKKLERKDLQFTYAEVADVMCEELLMLHFEKLHQGYIDRYNTAIGKMGLSSIGAPKTDEEEALLFNLGGSINHALFWLSFSPHPSSHQASEALTAQVSKDFGSFEELFDRIVALVPKIRGSGWIWLMYHPKSATLALEVTMNQAFPHQGVPLLNIDMWEHAYYLQYKVDKIGYLKKLYAILNWKEASHKLELASQ